MTNLIVDPATPDLIDPPNAPPSASDVQTHAVGGIKSMGLRTAFSVGLGLISSLALARLLSPTDWGIFGAASAIAGLGIYLADGGLGGALILQEREPDEDETTTVFWAQQGLVALVVAGIVLSLPLLSQFLRLTPASSTILMLLAGGLFLNSLRAIPMMVMDRRLRFGDIARCEAIENIFVVVLNVGLAALHWGAWALVTGALVSRTVGLALIWHASPWRSTGRFRWTILKRLLPMGIPLHLNALFPTALGSIIPMFISRYTGVQSFGLYTWASNLATQPSRLTQVLGRVAFPAFSRLQADQVQLGRLSVATTRRVGVFFSAVIPPFMIASPILIPLVFSHKWVAAVPVFRWFIMDFVLTSCISVLAQAQSSAGRAGDRTITVLATGLCRVIAGYFALRFAGINGIGPVVFATSALELCITAWALRKRASGFEQIGIAVIVPIASMAAIAGAAVAVEKLFPPTEGLWLPTLAALGVYFVLLALYNAIHRRIISTELHGLIRMLRPSQTR